MVFDCSYPEHGLSYEHRLHARGLQKFESFEMYPNIWNDPENSSIAYRKKRKILLRMSVIVVKSELEQSACRD